MEHVFYNALQLFLFLKNLKLIRKEIRITKFLTKRHIIEAKGVTHTEKQKYKAMLLHPRLKHTLSSTCEVEKQPKTEPNLTGIKIYFFHFYEKQRNINLLYNEVFTFTYILSM